MSVLLEFIFGIFIGSFLNVLVDRIPRNEGFLTGRSYCESCKKPLQWLDLLPIISFVALKGKCRYCHSPIGFWYPLVEVSTGVMFVATFFFVTQTSSTYHVSSIMYGIQSAYFLFVISSLIVIFFTDLKYGIIPDKILYPLTFVSFLYVLLTTQYMILPHLLSGVGAMFFFLVLFLGTKGRGMGFGDVKYAFFMGLLLGFPNIIVGLYIAFLTGAILASILVVWGKKKFRGGTIPFGPFLVLGTTIALFFGKNIIPFILTRFF